MSTCLLTGTCLFCVEILKINGKKGIGGVYGKKVKNNISKKHVKKLQNCTKKDAKKKSKIAKKGCKKSKISK